MTSQLSQSQPSAPSAPHENQTVAPAILRWSIKDIEALYEQPFSDLLYEAQRVHRLHFAPNEIQISTLLSIKTGGCPEDCGYCSQSAKYDTGIKATKLMELEEVLDAARAARQLGASRFCMGAAWRNPKQRDMPALAGMIRGVRALGMETCITLGMLTPDQATSLKDAGLDFYNHNIDTSADFYGSIVTTRAYQDRLDTLQCVRDAGLKICSGGILGMGENRRQRATMIAQLANLDPYPESVPINQLMPVKGTPLEHAAPIDPFEFVRTIAIARICMPLSRVRLSAGRENMSDTLQALCFMAGANSIFCGQKLLTTDNPDRERDAGLFEKLGLKPTPQETPDEN